MTVDIAELAVAWSRGDTSRLLPYVVGIRLAGSRTYAVMDTAVWGAIMDELDRQRQAAYDMKAATLGHRNWSTMLKHLSKLIEDGRAEEAGRLYGIVTGIANPAEGRNT